MADVIKSVSGSTTVKNLGEIPPAQAKRAEELEKYLVRTSVDLALGIAPSIKLLAHSNRLYVVFNAGLDFAVCPNEKSGANIYTMETMEGSGKPLFSKHSSHTTDQSVFQTLDSILADACVKRQKPKTTTTPRSQADLAENLSCKVTKFLEKIGLMLNISKFQYKNSEAVYVNVNDKLAILRTSQRVMKVFEIAGNSNSRYLSTIKFAPTSFKTEKALFEFIENFLLITYIRREQNHESDNSGQLDLLEQKELEPEAKTTTQEFNIYELLKASKVLAESPVVITPEDNGVVCRLSLNVYTRETNVGHTVLPLCRVLLSNRDMPKVAPLQVADYPLLPLTVESACGTSTVTPEQFDEFLREQVNTFSHFHDEDKSLFFVDLEEFTNLSTIKKLGLLGICKGRLYFGTTRACRVLNYNVPKERAVVIHMIGRVPVSTQYLYGTLKKE